MKKILATALAAALAVSISVPAFADEASTGTAPTIGNDGSSEITASGTFIDYVPATTSVSFTISWDSMDFTYNAGYKGDWDDESHRFVNKKDPSWSGEGNIVVENRSNVGIGVGIGFTSAENLNIRAEFERAGEMDSSTPTLYDGIASAAQADNDSARKLNVKMSINQNSGAITENGKLGTVQVTVSATLKLTDLGTNDTQSVLKTALEYGFRSIDITKPTERDTNGFYNDIRNAFADVDVLDGTIDLTIRGVSYVNNEGLRRLTQLNSVSLPDVTEEIGDNAFDQCKYLKSVSAPSATQVGARAFLNCESLKSVTLGAVTTFTGPSQFENCTSLTSISLPNLERINDLGGDYSQFENCTSLTSVSLPKLSKVTANMFKGCTALTEMTFGTILETVGLEWLEGVDASKITLTLAAGQKMLIGDNTNGWTPSGTDVTAGEGAQFCEKIFKQVILATDTAAGTESD